MHWAFLKCRQPGLHQWIEYYQFRHHRDSYLLVLCSFQLLSWALLLLSHISLLCLSCRIWRSFVSLFSPAFSGFCVFYFYFYFFPTSSMHYLHRSPHRFSDGSYSRFLFLLLLYFDFQITLSVSFMLLQISAFDECIWVWMVIDLCCIACLTFSQVPCGRQAGAFTCLLDQTGVYDSPKYADVEFKPDFKVTSLDEVHSVLKENFDLSPWCQGLLSWTNFFFFWVYAEIWRRHICWG